MSRIFYGGKYYDYPIKLANALCNLGIVEAVRCGLSFLWVASGRRRTSRRSRATSSPTTAGASTAHFFKTYNEKVWGVPASELSADWGAQRIKGHVPVTGVGAHPVVVRPAPDKVEAGHQPDRGVPVPRSTARG